jgi:hypothetical protein
MKMVASDRAQAAQRVKVGMIGLAAVLLLIGLAALVFSIASKDRGVDVAGAAQPAVVANMTGSNTDQRMQDKEPLAEIGVAPSATDANAAAPPSAQ